MFLPFIGKTNSAAWARRLELTAAVRYEDYDDVGSTTNSKFGALWTPVEGIDLRATYGTSFRAPYLYQYDSSLAVGVLFDAPDPASASPSGTTRLAAILQAPHPDLGPENAVTWTAGFDVAPEVFFGMHINATYFNILYEDRIAASGLSFAAFTDPALLPLIGRPADAAILAQIAAVPASQYLDLTGFPLSTAQATFDGRTRNQSRSALSGVDLTIEKSFETTAGRLTVGANSSYLLEFKSQLIGTVPSRNIVGTVFNPPELRLRGQASLTNGGWSFDAFLNFVDEFDDNQVTPVKRVASWSTIDLGAAYTFGDRGWAADGVTLRFNALNVFDKPPPPLLDLGGGFGNGGYDTENANPLGRLVSLQISKRW